MSVNLLQGLGRGQGLARGLQALAHAPRLVALCLDGCRLTHGAMRAVGGLAALEELTVSNRCGHTWSATHIALPTSAPYHHDDPTEGSPRSSKRPDSGISVGSAISIALKPIMPCLHWARHQQTHLLVLPEGALAAETEKRESALLFALTPSLRLLHPPVCSDVNDGGLGELVRLLQLRSLDARSCSTITPRCKEGCRFEKGPPAVGESFMATLARGAHGAVHIST